MASLKKMYVAYFFGHEDRSRNGNSKKPFASEKVVAASFAEAEDLANEWGEQKFNGRVRTVKVERSKGEVVCRP